VAIKVVNGAELKCLDVIRVNYFNGGDLRAGLFQDDYTPTDTDVLADYTAIEADFDGYAAAAMGGFVAVFLAAGKAYTAQAPIVWVPSGSGTPNDIYGFFVFDNSAGLLLWAGRFSSPPIVVTGPTTPVVYTPSFTLASES